MKQLFALALAAAMMATGVSPLMAANGDNGGQAPANIQSAAQPVGTVMAGPVVPAGGGVPSRRASPGQIATGAVVGTVLIGGTTFLLSNRRKGDMAPSSHAANRGPTPFMIFTHGSTHVHGI